MGRETAAPVLSRFLDGTTAVELSSGRCWEGLRRRDVEADDGCTEECDVIKCVVVVGAEAGGGSARGADTMPRLAAAFAAPIVSDTTVLDEVGRGPAAPASAFVPATRNRWRGLPVVAVLETADLIPVDVVVVVALIDTAFASFVGGGVDATEDTADLGVMTTEAFSEGTFS